MEGFGKKGKDDLMTPRWTEATVRYADAAEHLHVREIITWDRGDIPHPIMSASSGPKAYLRNDIYEVFQISPHVDRVVMVRASGPPFLLLHAPNGWFDMSARQVILIGNSQNKSLMQSGLL